MSWYQPLAHRHTVYWYVGRIRHWVCLL